MVGGRGVCQHQFNVSRHFYCGAVSMYQEENAGKNDGDTGDDW